MGGMTDLKPCPCGQIPGHINLDAGSSGGKWLYGSAGCCDEWCFEFKTGYETDPEKVRAIAESAWNDLPRATRPPEPEYVYRQVRTSYGPPVSRPEDALNTGYVKFEDRIERRIAGSSDEWKVVDV